VLHAPPGTGHADQLLNPQLHLQLRKAGSPATIYNWTCSPDVFACLIDSLL